MIEFTEIIAEGVFAISKTTYPINRRGPILVTGYSVDECGSNGAGKSSIISKALTWGLFGRTAGGLSGDDVVNQYVDNSVRPYVEIQFRKDGSRTFLIQRSRRPAQLFLAERTPDGSYQDLSSRNPADTQVSINSIIGRDLSLFLQIDFLGQGGPPSFLSLTPKDQKAVLERILSFQIEEHLYRTREWISVVRECREQNEKTASHLEGQYEATRDNLDRLIQEHASYEVNRIRQIELFEAELNTFRTSYVVSDEDFKELEYLDKRMGEINDLHTDSKNIWLQIHEKTNEQRSISSHIEHVSNELSALAVKINLLNVEDICPTCGNMLTAAQQISLREDFRRLFNYNNALTNNLDEHKKNLRAVEKELVTLKEKEEEFRLLDSELVRITIRQKAIKDKIASQERGESALIDRIASLRQAVNPHTSGLQSCEETIGRIEKLLESERKAGQKLITALSALNFWEGAFSKEIRNVLLARSLPTLNDRVAWHLAALNNPQISVHFSMEKELKSGEIRNDLAVYVKSATGGTGFDSLSGGEKQIVSFAVAMTLVDLCELQNIPSWNMMILDEPFTELDQRNIESLAQYISTTLSKKRDTIFAISNDDSMSSWFPNRMHVVKSGGLSTLAGD